MDSRNKNAKYKIISSERYLYESDQYAIYNNSFFNLQTAVITGLNLVQKRKAKYPSAQGKLQSKEDPVTCKTSSSR